MGAWEESPTDVSKSNMRLLLLHHEHWSNQLYMNIQHAHQHALHLSMESHDIPLDLESPRMQNMVHCDTFQGRFRQIYSFHEPQNLCQWMSLEVS